MHFYTMLFTQILLQNVILFEKTYILLLEGMFCTWMKIENCSFSFCQAVQIL